MENEEVLIEILQVAPIIVMAILGLYAEEEVFLLLLSRSFLIKHPP